MKITTTFLIAFLLLITTASISLATRPDAAGSSLAQPQPSKHKDQNQNQNQNKNSHQGSGGGGGGNDNGAGGFFGPGGGFNIPGLGSGWGNGVGGGYGVGYGGPYGGYSKGGVVRSSTVCKQKGPCYKKKLTCPAKCFTSYSHSGKNYGSGGGGGGCTIDCQKCVAYC